MATKSKSSSSRKSSGGRARTTGASKKAPSTSQKPASGGRKNTATDIPESRTYTQGIQVDQATARDDSDAYYGHFVSVTGGEHQGAYGTYEANAEVGDDGYPKKIIVRRRDDASNVITVNYSDCEPATAGRR